MTEIINSLIHHKLTVKFWIQCGLLVHIQRTLGILLLSNTCMHANVNTNNKHIRAHTELTLELQGTRHWSVLLSAVSGLINVVQLHFPAHACHFTVSPRHIVYFTISDQLSICHMPIKIIAKMFTDNFQIKYCSIRRFYWTINKSKNIARTARHKDTTFAGAKMSLTHTPLLKSIISSASADFISKMRAHRILIPKWSVVFLVRALEPQPDDRSFRVVVRCRAYNAHCKRCE